VTPPAEAGNPAQANLVFTTADFGVLVEGGVNQNKYMRRVNRR
jgi:hypothetical protein